VRASVLILLAPVLALPLALSGCTGGSMAALMPGEEITVGGDVFSVRIDGSRAVALNFATGTANQFRLYENAQEAIRRASGCAITDFRQEAGVNAYEARLDCTGTDSGPDTGPDTGTGT
jgi:hypothetical protein